MVTVFRRQVFISASVVVGGTLFLSLGLCWFARDIKVKANAIVEHKISAAQNVQIAQFLSELQRNTAEADIYAKRLDVLLPNEDQILFLSQWFEGIGKKHGVEVLFSLTATTPPQPGMPGFVGFDLSVRGKYENLINFFKDTESGARFIIAFQGFDFRKGGENDFTIGTKGNAFFR